MNRSVIIPLIILFSIGCTKDNEFQSFEPFFERFTYPDTLTTFTDERDSISYYQVQIGDQIWMAENLRYASGGSIGHPYQDQTGYPDYENVYGLLYSFNEAQNACPPGWRLPTDEDWKILEARFGLTEYIGLHNFGSRGSSQGNQMKSDSPHWKQPNTQSGNKDDLDFFILPAGYYSPRDLNYHDIGISAAFLSSSHPTVRDALSNLLMDSTKIIIRHFVYYSTMIDRSAIPYNKTQPSDSSYRFSVRCIKN
jgi:uncharacterized protein (TIGR02145 family)